MRLSKGSATTLKNRPAHRTVRVELGENSYPIYIGRSVLASAGTYIRRHRLGKTAIVITDTHVARLYLRRAVQSLSKGGCTVRSVVIPPGEKEKNLRRTEAIFSVLLRWGVDRNSTIIALGGGVIGDLAGFVAATYQRGVNFVQLPTTLLAQVDASVGGKVGVNHLLGKNMIGAFYQPVFVAADTGTLRTLPRREILCGVGEVVKYGIIMNRNFFSFIERNMRHVLSSESATLSRVVAECCRMKAEVVSRDEREHGLRAILNFGHTVGHALEQVGNYRALKHGEAVLIGMIAETFIACRLGMIPSADAARIESAILTLPMPGAVEALSTPSRLLAAMRVDKKVAGGKIRMVLPTSIGRVTLPVPVDEEVILESLSYLRAFLSSRPRTANTHS